MLNLRDLLIWYLIQINLMLILNPSLIQALSIKQIKPISIFPEKIELDQSWLKYYTWYLSNYPSKPYTIFYLVKTLKYDGIKEITKLLPDDMENKELLKIQFSPELDTELTQKTYWELVNQNVKINLIDAFDRRQEQIEAEIRRKWL